MIAHNAGKSGREILRQLILHGYAANKDAVLASLGRQGVANVNWEDSLDPTFRLWDAQANTLAMAQHNSGQTAPQIATNLNSIGYSVTKAEVAANLHRMGVQNVNWGAIPGSI